MGRVAWRKVLGDLGLARGRIAMLVLALTFSLTVVGAVLGAYGILSREMPRSFLSSLPASATLVLDHGIDADLLNAVRRRPEIAAADRRAMARGRIQVAPDKWLPLTIFVVEDFDTMPVETVMQVEGAWPPPVGTILLDRSSLPVLNVRPGAEMALSMGGGRPRTVRVAGTVFDPGVAPAWQEQTGYAYATPATLQWLGETADLDLLKIVVSENPLDVVAIERTAQELSAWLKPHGVVVEEIQIPPPGQHPHQRLMNLLAVVLLLFGLIALTLSSLLVATVVSAMLARHVRQIGSMKAIGALPAQIASMYGAMVLAIGAAAVILAIVPSVAFGQWLAVLYADLSNVALASRAIPWWALASVCVAGLGAPVLAAASPVIGASRMTIREAISEIGLYQGPSVGSSAGAGVLRALIAPLVTPLVHGLGPTLILALRQVVRRRGRLALSLILLAAGGGAFMSGLNVAAASDRQLAVATAAQLGFDLEVGLGQPVPTERLLALVRAVPGVAYVEPVGMATVAAVRPGAVPVAGTHKDGGHGTERLYALAPGTRFRPELLEGRWLEPGDVDAIAVASRELDELGTTLGGTITLSLAGKATVWRVVGVVRGFGLGGGSGLYVSDAGFAQVTGHVGTSSALRVVTTAHDPGAQNAAARALERVLAADGIGVAAVTDSERWTIVLRNHIDIVRGALQTLGAVLGIVGTFALASAMSLSVVERTREFGVMQTLGATHARVIWVVVAEALFVGGLSWLASLAVAVVLSSLVGGLIGSGLFGGPLPVLMLPVGVAVWLSVALAGSAAAGAFPAIGASRLTIRETLAYA